MYLHINMYWYDLNQLYFNTSLDVFFFTLGHPGGEERRGKRVHIANINNAGVNEWWLKSSSSSNPDRSSTRPQSQAQIRKLVSIISYSISVN